MKSVKNRILYLLGFLFFSLATESADAQTMKPKMVGGAETHPSKNIIENAKRAAFF